MVGLLRIDSSRIALAAFLVVQGGFGLWAAYGQRGVDFGLYYLAAHALRRGDNIYALNQTEWASLAAQYQVGQFAPPYAYPPMTAWLVSLFAGLPFQRAAIVWALLSVAALALAGLTLSRLFVGRWIDGVLFGALALYVPNLTTLYAGQVNTFALLGVALFLALLKWRWALAGCLALAVSIMFKPLAAPLIVHLLWRRDVRKVLAVGACLIAIAVAMVLVIGPGALVSYLESGWRVPQISIDGAPGAYPPNQSLFGFFGRALTAHEFGPSLVNEPGLARALALGVSSVLLLGVAIATWSRGGRDWNVFAVETGLVLATVNLVTPIGWYHHAVISIVPILALWHLHPTRWVRVWLAAAFVMISIQGIAWHSLIGYTPLLSLGTYGLMIVYGTAVWQLARTPHIGYGKAEREPGTAEFPGKAHGGAGTLYCDG